MRTMEKETNGENEAALREIMMEDCAESEKEATLREINVHYQVSCGHQIDLLRLSKIVGKRGRLHQSRPTMLTCRFLKKRMQFFPNGSVQLLGGGVTPALLSRALTLIQSLLKLIDIECELREWKINNAVFHFNLYRQFKLDQFLSAYDFSYEPELFPAALISKWRPAHVTLFPNGKGMITGVKQKEHALTILREVEAFFQQ